MAAANLDILIEQGANFKRTLKFTDNQSTPVPIDLTDTTGRINAVAVSPGDLIKVTIQRIAPSGTADTSDVRMISGSTEVSFNG